MSTKINKKQREKETENILKKKKNTASKKQKKISNDPSQSLYFLSIWKTRQGKC